MTDHWVTVGFSCLSPAIWLRSGPACGPLFQETLITYFIVANRESLPHHYNRFKSSCQPTGMDPL